MQYEVESNNRSEALKYLVKCCVNVLNNWEESVEKVYADTSGIKQLISKEK